MTPYPAAPYALFEQPAQLLPGVGLSLAGRLGLRFRMRLGVGTRIVGDVDQRDHLVDGRRAAAASATSRVRPRDGQRGALAHRRPGFPTAVASCARTSARVRRASAAPCLRSRSPRRRVRGSASGTFHWNASSRPVTGDTGIQRSDTKPSAVQAGSRARVQRARHPFARAAFVAVLASPRARPSASRRAASARSSSGASAARAIANSCASSAARATASAPSIWPGALLRPASARARAARARNRPGADAHRCRRDRDADWPSRPSRRCALALRSSPASPSSRPASAAAGTSVGRELHGFERERAWRCRDRSPRPRARARSAARRAGAGRSRLIDQAALACCGRARSSAPVQSPAAQRNSQHRLSGPGRAPARPWRPPRHRAARPRGSSRRCASMKRPCRPSSLVSSRSAMARNVRSAAARSPDELRGLRVEQQRQRLVRRDPARPRRRTCARRARRRRRSRSGRARSRDSRARRARVRRYSQSRSGERRMARTIDHSSTASTATAATATTSTITEVSIR